MSGIKIVFGGASIAPGSSFGDDETIRKLYDALEAGGVKTIDTAQIYQGSEELMGKTGAGKRFAIDSKAAAGFMPGSAAEALIVEAAKNSLKALGVDKLDIFYLHAPDPSVPIASTLAGINALHHSGVFTRFGLSNFPASAVREIHAHCLAHSYIPPTVYQGNYSAVARRPEAELFRTLRELGIAFYAYSPLAGGFLTKTREQILEGAGRFHRETPMGMVYTGMYVRPAYLDALAEWEAVAREAGVERAEMAYRWVRFNSPLREESGDALIFGASSLAQVEQTLGWLAKGPLGEETCRAIDGVWRKIEHVAPLDNYELFQDMMKASGN